MLALAVLGVDARTAAPAEHELKAVFLFNFSQFVEWPLAAFTDDEAPFVIGVLGNDAIGTALEEVVQGETVSGRRFRVELFENAGDITTCHILFLDRSQARLTDSLLNHLNRRATLTVADFEGFERSGGMVRFVTVANRLRLSINLEAAKAANLTISSKLLRLADIYESAGK